VKNKILKLGEESMKITVKKALLALFIMLSGVFFAAGAYEIKADAMTKRIPMGTTLELEAVNTITTETLSAGDMFSAYLTKDVYADGSVVLPKGTLIRGNSAKVVEAKKLSRSAVLYLNFDHIVVPSGKQLPLKAGISSNFNLTQDGGIEGGGGYGEALSENLTKSGDIIKKTAHWGVQSGEELFTGGKYLVTPFAVIGGTFAGAGYLVGDSIADLFRKGKNVIILKGQKFNILLLEPLDVPVF